MFLDVRKIHPQNTCARVSFLIKLQALALLLFYRGYMPPTPFCGPTPPTARIHAPMLPMQPTHSRYLRHPYNRSIVLKKTAVNMVLLPCTIFVTLFYISRKLTSFQYNNRSSDRRCSVRNDVLRNFSKFKGKHLC